MLAKELKEIKIIKKGFLGMLLGTLGASLLWNLLAGKGAIATSQGWGTIRAREGKIRSGKETIIAGQGF